MLAAAFLNGRAAGCNPAAQDVIEIKNQYQ
jgi:hypothetical protein